MSEVQLEQLEQLDKHGYYLSVPRGISMKPMIPNKNGVVEIHKITEPVKRYDLVMYVRRETQGVIHRVVRVCPDKYIIIGDNCWKYERVPKEDVKGIVKRFYRKGKWYEVTDWRYRIYVHLWTDLFFIRRPLFRLRDRLKAYRRKLKHAKE